MVDDNQAGKTEEEVKMVFPDVIEIHRLREFNLLIFSRTSVINDSQSQGQKPIPEEHSN